VLGQAGELAEAQRPLGGKRHLAEELLRHALREPRRLLLEEDRSQHHRAVDRDAARVIPDQHAATARRDVLDAERLDLEVAAVEPRERGEELREVLLRDAVGIVAEAVEGQLEPAHALADLGVDGGKRQGVSPFR
jgi:hypothetical protein